MNRQNRDAIAADQRAVEAADRKLKEIVAVIEDGGHYPALIDRLGELEGQRQAAIARLKEAPVNLPDVLPNVAEIYRVKIARLTEALNEPECAREASGPSDHWLAK